MKNLYSPSQKVLTGITNQFTLEICPWDDYFPRMAQSDFLLSRHNIQSSKTYFYREAPFGGSYAILGGLLHFLTTLRDYRFNDIVAGALLDQNYKKEFVDYLTNELQQIKVDVYAPEEGSIILPSEPAIIMEGNLVSLRFAEGILLKSVNFPTLAMTKWHRACLAAAPGAVMEFSRRRAQDDIRTSLYAHLAGAAVSSNSEIRRGFDIPITGTMGHEWIQSFGNEYEAFDKWLEVNPDRPVLLVDTIDTLNSGVPNAIKVFEKHLDRINAAGGKPGIRNDSGDLAYITIEERKMFDAAGLQQVIIYETNDLDEYSIQSIKEQIFVHAPKAGLDPTYVLSKVVFACGTKPGTCYDQPSLGGVAKLTSINDKAVIKIASDNPIKTSIPGNNRSVFVFDESGIINCCVIYEKYESYTTWEEVFHPNDETKKIHIKSFKNALQRQKHVFNWKIGLISWEIQMPTLKSVREHVNEELKMLHWTHKRFENPHKIKVSLTFSLFGLRQGMINQRKLIQD